jgi:phosphatidylglycerophosphatase A
MGDKSSNYQLTWRDGKDPAVLFVCGFGSGFIRYAPGTWGSLFAVAIWWMALSELSLALQLVAAALVYIVGSWLTGRVQRRYGVVDDSAIVADEVVGQWLALLMLPQDLLLVAAAFVLFRLFDIWKPGPIRWLERNLGGSQGVMADDVLAGLTAAAVLQVTIHTFS